MALAMDEGNFPGWQPEKVVQVVTSEGITRVLVKGQPYMSWPSGDEECIRLAIVQLCRCGLGTQEDLAQAFGRHVNSVQRYLGDFAGAGMQGLISERRGPKSGWKITPHLRGKILLIGLREGIGQLEAIQQRLAQAWHEEASLSTIQQVLEENGLCQPKADGDQGGVVQDELFGREKEKQMLLSLSGGTDEAGEAMVRSRAREKEIAIGKDKAPEGEAGARGGGSRRDYSSGQRIYLDQLEQGFHNAYAGGLLFAPLLARYDFLPILRRGIRMETYEGYSLKELGLTLFYLDLFEFRSMEDFKRAYREEFGVLVGRSQSPSLFTLRRFPRRVRELGRGETLIDEFAVTYLKSGLTQWGVMDIDGHFMPYYGLHPIRKGWHGVRLHQSIRLQPPGPDVPPVAQPL